MSLEKAKCATPDLAEETRKKLLELIPECAGDTGEIDFDKLKQALSSEVIEGNVERYEFTWPGKRKARAAASTPTTKTLRPCRDESVDYDTTGNLYIEGDNLEVLKLLQTVYAGKVKMIYIDPPYNTGHDFVYRDRFSLTDQELAERGEQQDDDGAWNINKPKNNEATAARYHSNWCSMMYPRVKVARNLLQDDGVIFISIDDNEVTNLRKLCNEIFGEKNFVGVLTWTKKTKPINSGAARYQLQSKIEYVIVYCKGKNAADTYKFLLQSEGSRVYNKVDSNGSVCRFKDILDSDNGNKQRATMKFPILGIVPPEGCRWKIGKSEAEKLAESGRLLIEDGKVKIVVYPYEESPDILRPFWSYIGDKVDTAEDGKAELNELMGQNIGFDTVKPVSLIQEMLLHMPNDSLVVDFFSGSATTAHAILEQNNKDGGRRKFIMVQLPEVCAENSTAAKAGYTTICDIGKERIRRAGAKIKEESGLTGGDLDVGFRVLKLASSSLREVSETAENTDQELANFSRIQDGRTAEDLLFQMLLETHIPLSAPIRQKRVGGNKVFVVNVGAGEASAEAPLVACLEGAAKMTTEFFIEVAKLKPGRAFFRDDAFADDSARTNLQQVFNQFSPSTTVTVI